MTPAVRATTRRAIHTAPAAQLTFWGSLRPAASAPGRWNPMCYFDKKPSPRPRRHRRAAPTRTAVFWRPRRAPADRPRADACRRAAYAARDAPRARPTATKTERPRLSFVSGKGGDVKANLNAKSAFGRPQDGHSERIHCQPRRSRARKHRSFASGMPGEPLAKRGLASAGAIVETPTGTISSLPVLEEDRKQSAGATGCWRV